MLAASATWRTLPASVAVNIQLTLAKRDRPLGIAACSAKPLPHLS